jgi:hypothetical protein
MPPKNTDAQKLAKAKMARQKEKRKLEKAISTMTEEKKLLVLKMNEILSSKKGLEKEIADLHRKLENPQRVLEPVILEADAYFADLIEGAKCSTDGLCDFSLSELHGRLMAKCNDPYILEAYLQPAHTNRENRNIKKTPAVKNKMAILLLLAENVIGSQKNLPSFRFFFDCLEVSFGATNDIRRSLFSKLGFGTGANRKNIMNGISSGILHHLEPASVIGDNTQINLNGRTSRITGTEHTQAVKGLSTLSEKASSSGIEEEFLLPEIDESTIDKIDVDYYVKGSDDFFNKVCEEQYEILKSIYFKTEKELIKKENEKNDAKRGHRLSSSSSNGSNKNNNKRGHDNNETPHNKRQRTPTTEKQNPISSAAANVIISSPSSFMLSPSKAHSNTNNKNNNDNNEVARRNMSMHIDDSSKDRENDTTTTTATSDNDNNHFTKYNLHDIVYCFTSESTYEIGEIVKKDNQTCLYDVQIVDTENIIKNVAVEKIKGLRNNKSAVTRGIIAKTYTGDIATREGLEFTVHELLKEVTNNKVYDNTDLLNYSKSQKIILAMDGGMFMDVASHKERLMREAEAELENDIVTSFKKFLMLERCAFIPGDLHLFFHYLAFIYLIFYGNILECAKFASYRFTIGHTTKDIIDSYREHRDLFLLCGRAALYASIEKQYTYENCSLFIKYFLFFRAMLYNAKIGNGAFFQKAMPFMFKCFVAVGKDKPHYRYLCAVSIENYKTFFSKWAKMQWLYNRFLKLVDVFVARDTFCEFYNWLQKKINVTTEEEFFAVANAAWPLYVIRSNFSSDSLVQQVVRNTPISKNRRGDLAHFYTLFMESNNMDNLWSIVENKYGKDVQEYREPEKVTENRKILEEMGKPTTGPAAEEYIWKGVKKPKESKVKLPVVRVKSRLDDIDFTTNKFKKKLENYIKLRKFKLSEKIKLKKFTLNAYNDYCARAEGDAERTMLKSGVYEKNAFDLHFHNDDAILAMIEDLKCT